jgi:hypothetical protein
VASGGDTGKLGLFEYFFVYNIERVTTTDKNGKLETVLDLQGVN